MCLLCKTILIINSQVSEHYFMDFLEKGECFDLTHSSGCVYPTLYIIRLLGRVYHFGLLICYPCPFITRNTFGLVSARSYKIVVVGNNRLVGWLTGNAVLSETDRRIFLIFLHEVRGL